MRISINNLEITMRVYELVLRGFNGNTDLTDHLVKWVAALNKGAVITYAKSQGWDYTSIVRRTELSRLDVGVDHTVEN
jgi:hypothetical protein